jgi:hypothetical protein
LEGLNQKYQRPLEAERAKELAEVKAKEEWTKALAQERKEQQQVMAQQ